MQRFSNTTFVTSLLTRERGSVLPLPEVVFIGRSNVGKSSLINALTGRKKLAYTSSKPGFTRLLNYFNVNDDFYLVDAPGYGYTAKGAKFATQFAEMMESYFRANEQLKHIYLLIDPRHKPSALDLDFLDFIRTTNYALTVVFTKSDKLNQSARTQAVVNFKKYFARDVARVFFTSSLKNTNINELKAQIITDVLHV